MEADDIGGGVENTPEDAVGTFWGVATGSDDVWAVGEGEMVFQYDGDWELHDDIDFTDTGGDLIEVIVTSVWLDEGEQPWVTTLMGNVFRYDGNEWDSLDAPTGQEEPADSTSLRDIWGSDSDNVWAIGGEGTVLHFSSDNWTDDIEFPHEDVELWSVSGSSAENVWAVGSQTSVAQYDGDEWLEVDLTAEIDVGSEHTLYGVWTESSTDVWIVGSDALVARFDGTEWQRMEVPVDDFDADFHSLGGSEGGDVWAGSEQGLLMRFPRMM